MSFRVLFIYPNLSMSSMVPHSIAVLSSLLKNNNIEVEVFNTTLYKDYLPNSNEAKVKVFNSLPYNFEERGIKAKESNIFEDFRKHVEKFSPDLIGISFVEDTFYLGAKLLECIRDIDVPVVAGGVFCTYAPEKVLKDRNFDFVIRGEGEKPLLELCKSLVDKTDYRKINNLCYVSGEKIICNPLNPPMDLDEIPLPDYSVFEEEALYRPMMGKIYRTIGIELHRGCPYSCTYCNSSSNNRLYLQNTGKTFFRKRSIKRFAEELDYMVKHYKPEFIYFLSDTFLLLTDDEFDEFCEVYAQYKIPFFMNTRAETVTEKRVNKLSEINCYRCNIGIEHGNEEFRRNVIKRNISDEVLERAITMVGESDISTVSNNIIGFPGENRKLIFDTINLNRRIEKYCDAISCTIFAPFHGTVMREKARELKYVEEDVISNTACNYSSILKMPQLTTEEIDGLYRTFSMYVRMPKDEWPVIEKAEKFNVNGEKVYQELWHKYSERYIKNRKHKKINA